MTVRTLIKLVLWITAFSILAATYGTRVLLYLETGHGLREVTCEQRADLQIAKFGTADALEDQKGCWSTLTGGRPEILNDTPPESVTDRPSVALH